MCRSSYCDNSEGKMDVVCLSTDSETLYGSHDNYEQGTTRFETGHGILNARTPKHAEILPFFSLSGRY
jgi:hypothetical protein